MASAKKKKPAKKKPAKAKAKAKPAKKAKKAKAKAKPAKQAKAKPAKAPKAEPAAATSGVEGEVARLLADYDAGNVDNAWDVLPQMMELDDKLSKSSSLRAPFDKMFGDIQEICAGG